MKRATKRVIDSEVVGERLDRSSDVRHISRCEDFTHKDLNSDVSSHMAVENLLNIQ